VSAWTSISVRSAADNYLDTLRAANTRRTYALAIDKVGAFLGPQRALADVADDEVGAALEELWGTTAVGTWNARRSAISSWLRWCRAHGYAGPDVPATTVRMTPAWKPTPVRPRTAIDRLTSRRDVPLREKTLWRMLYETAARASEILDLNVEDLDLPNRSALVRRKGAAPLRRGASRREDYDLRPVFWGAGTARLLSRHIQGRTAGPLFLTRRRPHAGRALTERDVDPSTGLARLHYDTARHELDKYTATAGPGTGWNFHELRASSLTHSAEDGASTPLLQGLSGHRDPKSLARYVRPSDAALRELAHRRNPR
jgi:integrase/recombinase XerC